MSSQSDPNFDLDKLRISDKELQNDSKRTKLPRHEPGERFLKGPIPLSWLSAAAGLPGKALHVGVVLWFWAGVTKSVRMRLSVAYLEEFGVKYSSAYRALKALERAGLIAVIRHRGRKPIVTILNSPALKNGG